MPFMPFFGPTEGRTLRPSRGTPRPSRGTPPALPRDFHPGPAKGPSPAQSPSPAQGQIFGNLPPGNLEIWDPKNPPLLLKLSKSKSMSPKMLARSGLVGKTSSCLFFIPFQVISSMGRKHEGKLLFSVVGPCCYPPLVGLLVFVVYS